MARGSGKRKEGSTNKRSDLVGTTPETTTDLTWGVYRRIYAGFIFGKRINSVSLQAEAWFWRINSKCDDFGNFIADPALVLNATVGRRKNVLIDDVTAWLQELVGSGLIQEYEADGEKHLHVVAFLERQPAGKNGRRVRRYPASPWDKDESGSGIRVNPGESSSHHDYDHDHSEDCGEPAGTPQSPPKPVEIVMDFPCIAGNPANRVWKLTREFRDELQSTFVGVNVDFELKKALMWLKTNASRQKTARGMPRFLMSWMDKEQNKGRPPPENSGNGSARPRTPNAPLNRAVKFD